MAVAVWIATLGALWVIFRADFAAPMSFQLGRGEAIYFLGCVAHSLYIPLIRILNRGDGALVFTLGTVIGAMVWLILAGPPALIATDRAALPLIVWITIVYTAVFATAASFALIAMLGEDGRRRQDLLARMRRAPSAIAATRSAAGTTASMAPAPSPA